MHGLSTVQWYSWFDKTAPFFYSWGLIFATLLRVVLVGGFLFLCLKRSGGKPLKSIRHNWRTPRTRDSEEHTAMLGLFESNRTVALTVGSLGLAAWSVLSAFHPAGIAQRSLGLELLFIGVLLSIGGPLLFRLEGSDGSEMGLESMVAVGYLALVFALSDILVSVFDRKWLSVIGVAIVVLMSIRESIEVRNQIRLTWQYVSSLPSPPAPGPAALAEVLVTPANESAAGGATAVTFRDSLLASDADAKVVQAWSVVFEEVENRLCVLGSWPWS